VTHDYASELLGYRAHSDGIWLEGDNFQGQFKPDKPWGEKTKPKYRSALGDYDAMLPKHPDNPQYWSDLETLKKACYQIDGHPCLLITEGFFKAVAGCSNEIPTIALLGVEMGLTPGDADPQGKRYLVPALEKFARAGLGFIYAFDADCATNKNVIEAQCKLFCQIAKFKVPQYISTGLWVEAEGKGMDDYIQKNGSDKFRREILAKAIANWEIQLKPSNYDKKHPPADIISAEIAEDYRNKLIFNNETATWMRYEADYPGVWSPETNEVIEAIVYQIIVSRDIERYNHAYIANIVKFLRCQLIERKWCEKSPDSLLPFKNGVLEIATGKLLPHSPGYRLTWQLPRHHNPLDSDWSKIDAFLEHLSNGNAKIKELLLCYCNAVLKGRHDLQKFLHLIGLGGTGKGTFSRLLVSLIGQQNVHTTTLEEWCGNRFEGANAYKKRLVLFPDEDKQTGKLGKFLSLTGEDFIRAEEKGKKAVQYRYEGMVLVLSNLPIFSGDSASRVRRRVVPVPCNNQVSPLKRRNLEVEFEPELAAFTNYVLSIPDEKVKNVITGLEEIPECTLEFWENRIRVDSIAAWINQHVIYDPLAETQIGGDRNEGSDGSEVTTLFGSYNQHCRKTGDSPKSHKNFSPDLLELCNTVLGWVVERRVAKTGKSILGLRLRTDSDNHFPTHDYALMQLLGKGDGCGDSPGDGRGDGSQALLDKGSDSCDDLIVNPEIKSERNAQVPQEQQEQQASIQLDLISEDSKKETEPALPSNNKHSQQSPLPSPKKELIIAVGEFADYAGDRVIIVGWENRGSRVQVETSAKRFIYVKRGSLNPWIQS
jgi:putative DNA primase/helicase